MEREFLRRLEEFRRRYYRELSPEELERCVQEAVRDGAVLRAYVCASEVLARREMKKRDKTKKKAVEGRKEEERPERRKAQQFPWQLYAGAVALVVTLVHPLAAFASLPVVAYLSDARRNTAPMWTEGDKLVWGKYRFKFYRVERVFRDVGGMGVSEFNNVLLAVTHHFNGVYYREGQLWILLEEGRSAEEARAVLRRFGVVVEPEPSPPPVALRRTGLQHAAFSLIPLLAFLASPAAGAAALLPALFMLMLSLRDVGAAVEDALSRNSAYYSVPDVESVHALARAAQPLMREALAVWLEDPEHLLRIERAGGWLERVAWWTASQWRLQRLGIVQVARQRILNLGERGFRVAGFVRGRPAVFAVGAPRELDAFTRDLAEFTPFALMLTPAECGEGAVRLGTDDAGREVCVSLDELQTPHAFVIGKSGAGKTTLGLSVAVQLWRRGVAPVAVDPHGHWAALGRLGVSVQTVDARHHAPPMRVVEPEDADFLLDVLRASGIQVYDVHFTVLFNALSKCGPADLAKLPDCLLKVRDISNAWAVDAVYGRLAALASMKTARVDLSRPLVVHTAGSTAPDARMKLVLWTIWLVAEAKRACPHPPCKMRWLLFVDEGHALMRDVSYIASIWRELRKFGVSAVLATQSISDVPQPLIENSGLKVVLAIEPEAVAAVAQRLYMPQSVVQRVAYEALPEERYAVVRAEGRAPIYVRLHPPPSG